jgi:hypothetical protein
MNRTLTRSLAASTDVDAHDFAMSAPLPEAIAELIELLGAPLVAVIGGVGETRAVQQWLNGRQPQRAQVLRFALQVATMIASSTECEMARAWFQGSNPHLGDTTPALLLRKAALGDVQPKIMAAARAFIERDTT